LSNFNIIDTVDKVVAIMQKQADDTGITISVTNKNLKEEDEMSPMIYTDEQRVMQVLLSLLSNAVKFTKKGSVEILVEIIKQVNFISEHNQKFLKISVKDTGIGIESKDQDKLFKLFGFVQQ
jgi:signal transduction histidine kinase